MRHMKDFKNRKTRNDNHDKRMQWGLLKNTISTSSRNRRVKVSLAKIELGENDK
jgi:hypothetical protein